MGTSLQNIVLEIMLVFQHDTNRFCLLSKLLQAPEIPFVERGEVVFCHTVPGQGDKIALHTTSQIALHTACAGERLFVEGSPGITILTTDAFVVIATTIRPKTIVLTEQ